MNVCMYVCIFVFMYVRIQILLGFWAFFFRKNAQTAHYEARF